MARELPLVASRNLYDDEVAPSGLLMLRHITKRYGRSGVVQLSKLLELKQCTLEILGMRNEYPLVMSTAPWYSVPQQSCANFEDLA